MRLVEFPHLVLTRSPDLLSLFPHPGALVRAGGLVGEYREQVSLSGESVR